MLLLELFLSISVLDANISQKRTIDFGLTLILERNLRCVAKRTFLCPLNDSVLALNLYLSRRSPHSRFAGVGYCLSP